MLLVHGGAVVLTLSPSSCSLYIMEDQVVNKTSHAGQCDQVVIVSHTPCEYVFWL